MAERTLSTSVGAEFDRDEAIDRLMNFDGSFRFDFTREYLTGLSDGQIRHVLIAACKYAHSPDGPQQQ